MIRRAWFLGVFAILACLVPSSAVQAIEVCYDYAIYRLTGTDPRPPGHPAPHGSDHEAMIAALKAEGYARVVPNPSGRELRADDVVLLAGHVGYVTAPDAIDHFIQVEGTAIVTPRHPGPVRYPADALPTHPRNDRGEPLRGGFFEGDTLETFMTQRSFRVATMYQVWRKEAARDARFFGAWTCPARITLRLNADGTGAWVDNRGGPAGSMSESGTFAGTWTSSGDTAYLDLPVATHGHRGGVVELRLSDGQLHDRWGDIYSRD